MLQNPHSPSCPSLRPSQTRRRRCRCLAGSRPSQTRQTRWRRCWRRPARQTRHCWCCRHHCRCSRLTATSSPSQSRCRRRRRRRCRRCCSHPTAAGSGSQSRCRRCCCRRCCWPHRRCPARAQTGRSHVRHARWQGPASRPLTRASPLAATCARRQALRQHVASSGARTRCMQTRAGASGVRAHLGRRRLRLRLARGRRCRG